MYAKIRDKYPSLTETESKVFLLSCININNQDMADLLELKIHTINKERILEQKNASLTAGVFSFRWFSMSYSIDTNSSSITKGE